MKILFAADVPPDPDSGAAGTELQTIAGLRRLGHEVDEIWASDLGRRIKHGNLHYLLELPFTYRKVIRQKCIEKAYDVIHVNQGHCYLAAKEHRESKRPGIFICRSHGLDDHWGSVLKIWRKKLGIRNRSLLKVLPGYIIDQILERHIKLATRLVDGFIVSSSLDREFLIKKHCMLPVRVACIPQAAPDRFISHDIPAYNKERLRNIMYVAGFNYFKSPQTVADAINGLVPHFQDFIFTWVCNKTDHHAARKLLSPTAQKRSRLVGWTTQEELMKLYDLNGIFIYPSLFDGFGKVFLEAMARGLCVIGTRTGGMKDIIEDGKNGFHVRINEPQEIIEKILYLIKHPGIAAGISESAVQTARKYSWDRVAKETAGFYQRVVEKQNYA